MKRILVFAVLLLSITLSVFGQKEDFSKFIPKGYKLFKVVKGDLNKDNVEDRVLVVKGTSKAKFVKNMMDEVVDRNRRGLVILFKKGNRYEEVLKNLSLFASENEDGGAYFAPELSVEVTENKLYFSYGHGRYGNWLYTFRYQNNDFALIGYDREEAQAPIALGYTSINYLTKKMQIKENVEAELGRERFEETWYKLNIYGLTYLSKIKYIDDLNCGKESKEKIKK
ncbi:MAG TPA: hypothetical protein PLN63_03385 [Paludibacteraceae bacterium]|jgi:hypothetical protein|nr:hypothetical protein [Paludibacteraceae bacterium]HOU68785.1 hypothetical protein [Paludibacteraceae bacterium]HPH62648.1 hypothetical protein [Paludibacteraceae bacterium]